MWRTLPLQNIYSFHPVHKLLTNHVNYVFRIITSHKYPRRWHFSCTYRNITSYYKICLCISTSSVLITREIGPTPREEKYLQLLFEVYLGLNCWLGRLLGRCTYDRLCHIRRTCRTWIYHSTIRTSTPPLPPLGLTREGTTGSLFLRAFGNFPVFPVVSGTILEIADKMCHFFRELEMNTFTQQRVVCSLETYSSSIYLLCSAPVTN